MFEALRRKADLEADATEKVTRLSQLMRNLGIDLALSADFAANASYNGKMIRVMHPDYLTTHYKMTAGNAELGSMYLLLHEMAHALFSRSDVTTYIDSLQARAEAESMEWDKFYLCMDACEDVLVDFLMANKYHGVKDYQTKGGTALAKALYKEKKMHPLAAAVLRITNGYSPAMPAKETALADKIQAILENWRDTSFYKDCHGRDPFNHAKQIYDLMFKKEPKKSSTGSGSSEEEESSKSGEKGRKVRMDKEDSTDENEDEGSDSGEDEGSEDGEGEDGDTEAGEEGTGDAEGDTPDEGEGEGDTEESTGEGDDGDGDVPDEEQEPSGEEPREIDNETESVEDADGGGEAYKNIGKPLEISDAEYKRMAKEYGAKIDKSRKIEEDCSLSVNSYPYEQAPWIKGARTLYKQMETLNEGAKDLRVRAVNACGDVISGREYKYATTETTNLTKDLTRRLKQIIQQETMAHSYGHMNGQLDTKRLHRIECDDSRVFKQRDEKSNGGIAVQLLLDASGSMGGTTVDMGRLALILGRALEAHGIKVKITTHTTDSTLRAVRMLTVKDWDTKEYGGLNAYESMGDNRDDVAIYLSGLELLTRPEEKKLLVVFSDGQPADGTSKKYDGTPSNVGSYSGKQRVKGAIQKLRNSGVRVVGVYWDASSLNYAERFAAGVAALEMSPTERAALSGPAEVKAFSGEQVVNRMKVFKEMYGDDFMVCPRSDWKTFPARIMRALSNVFRR